MIKCAITKPPQIPTASMRKEIPAAAPLDTPFVFTLLFPPGFGWLDGLAVAPDGSALVGLRPTKNEDLAA